MRHVNESGIEMLKRWAHVGHINDCWQYKGRTFVKSGNGACTYGQVKYNGKTMRAHRVAWELCIGAIPAGNYICHACDNPLCLNPWHLFVGTAMDNNRDKMQKGRHRAAKGEKNGNSTLSDANAVLAANMARAGVPQKVVAARFGVSPSLVSLLKNGRTRSWLVA